MRAADMQLSLPFLLVALAIAAIWDNMVALLYLVMTLLGSVGVRALERWAKTGR